MRHVFLRLNRKVRCNWKSSRDLNWQWSHPLVHRSPIDEPVVRASFLSVFGDYCRAFGVNPNHTYRRAGLSYEMIRSPGAPVPLFALSELFELAAADLDDEAFGLHFAEWMEPGHLGLIDQLILSADTFHHGLQLAARYIETTVSQMSLQLSGPGALITLSGRLPSSLSTPAAHFADFLIATLVFRGCAAIDADWRPVSAALMRRQPDDTRAHERYLGPKVVFGAPEFQISMRRDEIDVPMTTGWPGLGHTVRQMADIVLADEMARQDFVGEVKRLIISRFNDEEEVNLAAVAGALGLSTRSLQWRLSRHQANFETVLKDVRVALAQTLLRDTTRPLAAVGRSLGFSEGSAFTRWSRTQFNMPPNAYRKFLRAQK